MVTAASRDTHDKFFAHKSVHGGITYLSIGGTLNNDFTGRKVAKLIKTDKVVINMREVRRFASWGMSEWMEFLRLIAERDTYMVECSTYALAQLNLVTGLLGHVKLVSYYASFRCRKCGEELETQFVIPRDRERIRELPETHQDCMTCGGRALLEEYPAAFFEAIADRPAFDIDDEVLAYFRSQLKYDIAPDVNRFRAYRAVQDQYTYLRLSGNLGALPPDVLLRASEGSVVVDIEKVITEDADMRPWLAYVTAANEKVKTLQLVNCPPGFLERGVRTNDLKQKLKVRSFAQQYDCMQCERTSVHVIDVANNLEQLAEGTPPTVRCTTCSAALVAVVNTSLAMLLRTLPARDRNPALDKLLASSRTKPNDKLENCLTTSVAVEPPKPARTTGRAMYVAFGLSTALVVCLAVVGFWLWTQRTGTVAGTLHQARTPPPPTFTRPDWIISQVPSSAYCHDMINRLMCVGVSSYRPTKEDAVIEASDAALEELVNAVALKITTPFFRESVLPNYSAARAKLLSALQSADIDRKTQPDQAAVFVRADETVRMTRKRVVETLLASGGAAVPTQRSDWYWEEYAGEKGKPNEILVFVRYDVSLDAMRALVETYGATMTVNGTVAMTAFPALGWSYADFAGGAQLVKVHRKLASAGIEPQHIVTAFGDERVVDVAGFARRMSEAKDAVKLTVRASQADAKPKVVEVRL